MGHPLEGCLTKLLRARHHVEAFESCFERLMDSGSYEPTHEMNLNTGEYWIKMRLDPVPAYFGTMIGDFAHNARSALDYLMWELVLDNRSDREPDDPADVMFPIADSSDWFGKRRVLKFLTSDQRAIAESFQTYLRDTGGRDTPLVFLRELSNQDKHRNVAVIANVMPDNQRPVVGNPVFQQCGRLLDPHFIVSGGPVEDGTTLAYFRFERLIPESRVKMNFQITLEPAIDRGEFLTPLFPAVYKTISEIRRIIRLYQDFFPPIPNVSGEQA